MAQSEDGIGDININFVLPEMPNTAPATDKQKFAVQSALSDEFDTKGLTMGQASLLLDVTAYANGMLDVCIKGGIYDGDDDSAQKLFRVVAIEAIMQDEKLRRDINDWGRFMYSSGKASRLPKLDPKSSLFKAVFSAFTKHINTREF